jgi:hypothetical protein
MSKTLKLEENQNMPTDGTMLLGASGRKMLVIERRGGEEARNGAGWSCREKWGRRHCAVALSCVG